MNPQPDSNDAGYSPLVTMELVLSEKIFNVAAFGGDTLALRDPRPTPAGAGVVRMVVNGSPLEFEVFLPDGVNPTRAEQPCRVIRAVEFTAV